MRRYFAECFIDHFSIRLTHHTQADRRNPCEKICPKFTE